MIVGEEGECVYLCDGRLRGVEHPKKKKKKHIQIIKDNRHLTLSIEEKEQISNEAIKRAIKEYGRRPV